MPSPPTDAADPRLASPRWRLNNLYWITNKQGEKVRFKMNWAQTAFYGSMWYLSVILKARQLGFSTFILIFILDRCLFNSNVRAGVIAHTKDDAKVLFRDKLKFAYDNLPDWLREARSAVKNDAGELVLSNNSSIRVGTSMRGGTLQYLHISEYGKICARYPEKAREIQTGALNAVAAGCFVLMESTAEGEHGDFADTYRAASSRVEAERERTTLDFEPFFYPWWQNPEYTLESEDVVIDDKLADYFRTLAAEHGIMLSEGQKAWYAKKRISQGALMTQEYPSYPSEAFNQPIEGTYFYHEMLEASEDGRIVDFPINRRIPVNTFWDLGLRETDTTCIWFHQRIGLQDRFIDFVEDHGRGLDHYMKLLDEKGYRYGSHYLPHDIRVREIGNGAKPRFVVLQEGGIGDLEIVQRCESKADTIDNARARFAECVFHRTRCEAGIAAVRAYRREYDERLQAWKSAPRHDWASNPMDAFFTFTDGYEAPNERRPGRRPVSNVTSTSIATA